MNKDRIEYWVEYMNFERDFFDLIEERERYLIKQVNKGKNDEKTEEMEVEPNNSDLEEEIELEDSEAEDNSNQGEMEEEQVLNLEQTNKDKETVFNKIMEKLKEIMLNRESLSEEEKKLIEKAVSIYKTSLEDNRFVQEFEEFCKQKVYGTSLDDSILLYFQNKEESKPEVFNSMSFKQTIDSIEQLLLTNKEGLNYERINEVLTNLNVQSLPKSDSLNLTQITDFYVKHKKESQFPQSLKKYLNDRKHESSCFEILLKLSTNLSSALSLLKQAYKEINKSNDIRVSKEDKEIISEKLFTVLLKSVIQQVKQKEIKMDKSLIDKLFKMTELKKRMLTSLSNVLIEAVKEGLFDDKDCKSYLFAKSIKLRNYCPVGIVLFGISAKELQEKESLFEEFLRYNPFSLALWKNYMTYLKRLTKIEKLERVYKKALKSIEKAEEQELCSFYAQLI